MPGPLENVKVVDLSSVGMGPMATQMLGDMGADVIKVEPPDGDVFRHVAPQRHDGMSHAFLNFNRNKRSIVADLKNNEDLQAVLKLIADADVFVSNMRSPVLRRFGLDHASLASRHPRLIHCVCYGYSDAGPYAGRPAIDDTIQAACGIAAMQGAIGDQPPRYVNSVVADKVVGLYASNAIAMALFERERSGLGQAIEVPMFESMVAFLALEHLAGETFIPSQGEVGYARLLNEFRRPFRSKDGYISVAPYTSAQWRRFFHLAGRPEMADDARFRTGVDRSRHFAELYSFVEDLIVERTNAEWIACLKEADLPFAPVNSLTDLLRDEHLLATGFWRESDHPTEGRLRTAGIPIRFSRTPGAIQRHAPNLGEHTAEILGEKR